MFTREHYFNLDTLLKYVEFERKHSSNTQTCPFSIPSTSLYQHNLSNHDIWYCGLHFICIVIWMANSKDILEIYLSAKSFIIHEENVKEVAA